MSRESVAWVTRSFICASRRRNSSWLEIASLAINLSICPCRNRFWLANPLPAVLYASDCIIMRTVAWLVNKKLIFRIGFLIRDRLYRIEPHASRCYPHCNGRDLLESCSTAGIIALAGASSGGGIHRAASRPGGVVPRFGCAAARRSAFRLLESRPARP